MIRTPVIRVAAIGIAVLVLYSLSVFLRPQVIYIDKANNEIIKDFKASDMDGASNIVEDTRRNVGNPIKNNDKEQEQGRIQIEEAELDEASVHEVVDSSVAIVQETANDASDVSSDKRVKATFVTLARNSELYELIKSVRRVEDRFNRKFNYDWVFLNDEPFTDEFKNLTTSIVSGKTKYGVIPTEHWSYPDWIDLNKAAESRAAMKAARIIYGDSESYRHMCRFESGFFWQNPLLDEYDWYWRVEPGIQIHCDLDYDLFKYMEDNNKVYGFTISIYEFEKTIPSLWGHVKDFIKKNPQYLAEDNLMDFISDNKGETYNLCHFWSNFEVASLKFWRSQAYRDFFEYLDKTGGFFYERWGDAPIHSIAAALFLSKNQVHYFEDVGYNHGVYTQCPLNAQFRYDHKCHCNPDSDFTFRGYSCGTRYYDVMKKEKPKEWIHYT